MRARSHRKLPIREAFFLLVVLGVAGLISWMSGRTLVLAEILRPALEGVQAITNAYNSNVDRVTHLQNLEKDNAELKQNVADLEIALQARDEQAAENERLHRLLKMQVPTEAQPITVARVIGRNPDNWHQRLMLDRGKDSGLMMDAVVANEKGAIGRVVTLSHNTALVSLMTDPQSAIAVLNTRTRSAGVVQGQGDAWPVLRYMEQPEKWKVGDHLITSGLGGIWPKGMSVGRIVQLKNAANSFFPELRVQPAVKLESLEEVVVMPPGMQAMPVPSPRPTPTPDPSAKPSPAPSPGKKL